MSSPTPPPSQPNPDPDPPSTSPPTSPPFSYFTLPSPTASPTTSAIPEAFTFNTTSFRKISLHRRPKTPLLDAWAAAQQAAVERKERERREREEAREKEREREKARHDHGNGNGHHHSHEHGHGEGHHKEHTAGKGKGKEHRHHDAEEHLAEGISLAPHLDDIPTTTRSAPLIPTTTTLPSHPTDETHPSFFHAARKAASFAGRHISDSIHDGVDDVRENLKKLREELDLGGEEGEGDEEAVDLSEEWEGVKAQLEEKMGEEKVGEKAEDITLAKTIETNTLGLEAVAIEPVASPPVVASPQAISTPVSQPSPPIPSRPIIATTRKSSLSGLFKSKAADSQSQIIPVASSVLTQSPPTSPIETPLSASVPLSIAHTPSGSLPTSAPISGLEEGHDTESTIVNSITTTTVTKFTSKPKNKVLGFNLGSGNNRPSGKGSLKGWLNRVGSGSGLSGMGNGNSGSGVSSADDFGSSRGSGDITDEVTITGKKKSVVEDNIGGGDVKANALGLADRKDDSAGLLSGKGKKEAKLVETDNIWKIPTKEGPGSSKLEEKTSSPSSSGLKKMKSLPMSPDMSKNPASGLMVALSPIMPFAQPNSTAMMASPAPSTIHLSHSNSLAELQARAQKRLEHLNKIGLAITAIVKTGEIAGGWVPCVAQALEAVEEMWTYVQDVSVSQCAGWRMVERCAGIMELVGEGILDILRKGGEIPDSMAVNLMKLNDTLQRACDLITKLANRSFLKLFLRCDELNGAITQVNEELEDCVRIFQIRAAVDTASWQAQSENDRRKDTEALMRVLQDAAENDDKMWKVMQVRNDELQESIKTIQRTLDAVLALQAGQPTHTASQSRSSPTATLHPQPVQKLLGIADGQTASPIGSEGSSSIDWDSRTRSHGKRRQSKSARTSPLDEEEERRRNEAIAGPIVREHVHFLQRGYDVLCRRSSGSSSAVPDWTITNLEISHDEEIASGNYSTVWRGKWQNQVVAIKMLNELTDKELFFREVEVWRPLNHENVLQFWGASISSPFFLVSPYMANKDLLTFLKSERGQHAHKVSLLHGIAKGMEFLHSRDVRHGVSLINQRGATQTNTRKQDLKANNVLISNNMTPMICDFGMAEVKIEIERKSRRKISGGALRWMAPELLRGDFITFASDVYAFAITTCEVLEPRQIPYGLVDSKLVEQKVLHSERCTIPPCSAELQAVVRKCWSQDPGDRPSFEAIVPILHDIMPAGDRKGSLDVADDDDSSISSAEAGLAESFATATDASRLDDDVQSEQLLVSPPTSVLPFDSDEESITTTSSLTEESLIIPDPDEEKAEKVARTYRHHLTHPFGDLLRDSLWYPAACEIGDIGYVTKDGRLCVLYNSRKGPPTGTKLDLPVPILDEFAPNLPVDTKAIGMRNLAERAVDSVAQLTNRAIKFVSSRSGQVEAEREVEWTYSFPMSALAQQRRAGLVVNDATYMMLKCRDEARRYLQQNIEAILEHYGPVHNVKKEDIIMIVGGVFTSQWALMLASHDYGRIINFNVHKQRQLGRAWGTWSIADDKRVMGQTAGELATAPRFICKVSDISAVKEAVLLARMKFPSSGLDRDRPTLL